MANTYIAIATVTVGSGGASSIDFTSIPGTYTDLCILYSARSSDSATNWNNLKMTFNGSTANQTWRFTAGYNNGTATAGISGQVEIWVNFNGSTGSTFGNALVYIPNYTSSNNKPVSIETVTEGKTQDQVMGIVAGLWSNSSAITSIGVTPSSGTFMQNTTATLYGIKKN